MSPTDSSNDRKPCIQRTFRDLSHEQIADMEWATMLVAMGWSGAFGWDTLLQSQRVLIISEAGAGKTYECRAQQQALWNQGEPAFYLDLAPLANNALRELLSADEEARLDAWLAAQSDVATFFLDSIDELKLTLGSFETALKRLSKTIAGQLGRARIIITTRPIAVDQQLIEQHLPVPDPVELAASGDNFADIMVGRRREASDYGKQEVAPVWRTVALMPFSEEQIQDMATIEGVEDADALLADIRARDAEDFARRPQDLVELCADWREHHRVRTHGEQVEHNVRVKLTPRTDRYERAQLSHSKALVGASRLALASLLTRKLTIRLSAEADRGGEPGTALDPIAVLPDWTPEERATLLERALFGFASYGRIRFHHRSVVEFLAGQRLTDRLDQGMPLKAVKRLLFAETPQGVRVVRPTMRPVAAWLAPWQPSIFSEIREREPNVLFDHADPEALSLRQRVDALHSYVRIYGRGGQRGLNVPKMQVHRFASPDLADHVSDLWWTGIENHEVRELLLELIGAGAMSECADIAHDVAMDGTVNHGERLSAIVALSRLSDPRIEAVTESMLATPDLWPDPLVRKAIVQLFPGQIAADRLCEILKRVRETATAAGEIGWMLPHHIAAVEFPQDYLASLRSGLTELVTEGLAWKKSWPHLATERPELLSPLAAACLRLIRAGETDADVLRSSVIALRLKSEDHRSGESLRELEKELAALEPPLRETAFWADDTFRQNLHYKADPWERLLDAHHDGPLTLNGAQDGMWVHHILADPECPLPERTMMLYASMHSICNTAGSLRDHIESLKQYVADAPELTALIDRHLAPREVSRERAEVEAQIEQDRQAVRTREAEKHASWLAFWREVAEHPETAFSADREDDTAWTLWWAMQRSGDESRASGWNRRFIEKQFGKEVANQLRTTMRSIWRKERPTLPHERSADSRNEILIRWQLGLAAIAAEAEDPSWVRKLSTDEAELATRYAPIELNGFPTWFEALTRQHPVTVERTLGPELTAELEDAAAPKSFDILLQNVTHAPTVVVRLFLPHLRTWFDAHASHLIDGAGEAAALRRLERVLEALLEHGDDTTRDHIRAVAQDQLNEHGGGGVFTQVWLTTLMRLDPPTGITALERLLEPLQSAASGTAIDIFDAVFCNRDSSLRVDLQSSGFTPPLLLRLARLAYRHVRPSDDISHEGVYTPGPRDDAQTARNTILRAILDAEGAEAWAVKLEMVKDPLFAHFRDRLTVLAREKAAEETDGGIFSDTDAVQFDDYGEAPPVTRDDMFAVLADRLDDLDDLLLQDVSPRAAWADIKAEKVMRQVIALQLRTASNHVYTVDQEAVTADEKETDIRLRVASSGQQATIELKIGERWSGRELRDTIQNQLVTKYMAAEGCRAGCLLVTVASDHRWRHPDTDEYLDTYELAEMLDAEAARIVDELGDSLRLAVKVLDLRPRLVAEPKV